jgi:hypothetical protein
MIGPRRILFLVAVAVLVLSRDVTLAAAAPDDDRAIVGVVLRDFGGWKEATFGELEGVLLLDPVSRADHLSVGDVRSLARNISDQISNDLIEAFIERNRSAISIASLVSGSSWARLREPTKEDTYPPNLPKDAKAIGSLTLPGISGDGDRALVMIRHSWSIHSAVVTYVLAKQSGAWRITARDQAVFL